MPTERLNLAGLVKKPNISFYDIKGIIEQLLADLIEADGVPEPCDRGLGARNAVDVEPDDQPLAEPCVSAVRRAL